MQYRTISRIGVLRKNNQRLGLGDAGREPDYELLVFDSLKDLHRELIAREAPMNYAG